MRHFYYCANQRISVRAVANAHSVMIVMLDVADFVVIRRGDRDQRCGQRGAKHQGGQTGERLDNGFHGQALGQNSSGLKPEPELYRRVPDN